MSRGLTGRSTRTYYWPALRAYCPPVNSNVMRHGLQGKSAMKTRATNVPILKAATHSKPFAPPRSLLWGCRHQARVSHARGGLEKRWRVGGRAVIVRAMLSSLHRPAGKSRACEQAWLALAATHNKSFDTDVLSAGVARLLSAGQLQRYATWPAG